MMKETTKYFKEMGKFLRDFLRRDFIKEDILKQSSHLKKVSYELHLFDSVITTMVFNIFAYMTLAGNYAIEKGFGILGIFIYMLNFTDSIVNTIMYQWREKKYHERELAKEDAIILLGGKILTKISNNIYQKRNNQWNQVSGEEIINCITEYLENYWYIINSYWFNIMEALIAIGMLISNIIINKKIPQSYFITILIITAFSSFICTLISKENRSRFRNSERSICNKKSIIKNDILRVIPIIAEDQESRIRRYKNLSSEHIKETGKVIRKDFIYDTIDETIHILASCTIVILYVKGCNQISLATIAGIMANLAIFNRSISSFRSIINLLNDQSMHWDNLRREEVLMNEMLKVYSKSVNTEIKPIESLKISSFEIMYNEKSENDKPFTLKLERDLNYEMGDRIVLTGASGSGKSTLLKICTKRIMFKQISNKEISPTNYMYYDDTIDFGSMPLWEELFCLDKKTRIVPKSNEIEKMEYILKNLMIYQEIDEICNDFWMWTKQHTGKELSRGQKQRMIIGKILFWLDEKIDIIALDECTSGLDTEADEENNADAIKILQFIIDYCNRDRRRIIFLATHQNINDLCNHRLHFRRNNGQTTIEDKK